MILQLIFIFSKTREKTNNK